GRYFPPAAAGAAVTAREDLTRRGRLSRPHEGAIPLPAPNVYSRMGEELDLDGRSRAEGRGAAWGEGDGDLHSLGAVGDREAGLAKLLSVGFAQRDAHVAVLARAQAPGRAAGDEVGAVGVDCRP